MPHLFRILFLVSTVLTASAGFAREEIVSTSDNRKIAVELPEGFSLKSRASRGVVSALITNAELSVSLEVDFVPDPNSRLGNEEKQKNLLAQLALTDAEQSVEKGYNFKSLDPRSGSGVYCSFTDANVKGKTSTAGEFLKLTRGVKTWSGFALVFSLLSQDESSDAYLAAMKMLRESFEEKKSVARGPSI